MKNLFNSLSVADWLRDVTTLGVLWRDDATKVCAIGEPMGVVAALIPVTNPTSTIIFKVLSAVKASPSRPTGCAPCRDQLVTLDRHRDDIAAAGGMAIGIGPAADYQARLLRDRAGIPFPLLLDPDHEVARRAGLHRMPLARFVFDLRAWWWWLKAFVKRGQGRIVGAYWETPAILVLDAGARVRWSYLGRSIGDYPPIATTLRELRRVAEEGSADPGR